MLNKGAACTKLLIIQSAVTVVPKWLAYLSFQGVLQVLQSRLKVGHIALIGSQHLTLHRPVM